MEQTENRADRSARNRGSTSTTKEWRALLITALLVGVSVASMDSPLPAGLPAAGQRVLAVAVMAIGLWCTGAIPAAVTGLLVVIALTLLLPSATTRTGILIHVYEQALDLSGVPLGAPLVKAVMLSLNNITGFLATTIPITMSIGATTGINPVIDGNLSLRFVDDPCRLSGGALRCLSLLDSRRRAPAPFHAEMTGSASRRPRHAGKSSSLSGSPSPWR
jgi:hypothetical protein